MKKWLCLTILSMFAMLTHAQSGLTLDGFAEADLRKSCDNSGFDKNVNAIGALSFNMKKGWSATIEAEFNKNTFALTQLFVTKVFSEQANLKIGQITVPIGQTVSYDRPENHLTVYIPECECAMIPYRWDQLGLSFFGERKGWAYNAMCLIDKGCLAAALRVDNTQLKGLRVGLSGYFGKTYLYQIENPMLSYDTLGNLLVAGIDYSYEAKGIITHGYATFSNARGGFKHHAFSVGAEFGYDVLSGKDTRQQLVPFVRCDYFNTIIDDDDLDVHKTKTHRIAAGISYRPHEQVFVKAEYARYQHHGKEGENFVMLGVAVSGVLDLTGREP